MKTQWLYQINSPALQDSWNIASRMALHKGHIDIYRHAH